MTIFENIALHLNTSTNTTGTRKGSDSIGNAKNEILSDMAMRLLNALESGDAEAALELKARVRDILQNQITLTLPDASVISGRTDTLLPLSIGDDATFKASLTPEGQLTLSLLSNDSEAAPGDTGIGADNPLVKKALTSANIPANPRSMLVTSELLNAGQSVAPANIKKFITLSLKNPDIPVKELILLDANKVPVTPENLRAFYGIANGETVWDHVPLKENDVSPPADTAPLADSSTYTAANTPIDATTPTDTAAPTTQSADTYTPAAQSADANTPADANLPAVGTPPADTKAPATAAQPADTNTATVSISPADTKAPTDASAPAASTAPADAAATTDSKEPSSNTSAAPAPIEPQDFSEEAVKKFYGALKKAGEKAATEAAAEGSRTKAATPLEIIQAGTAAREEAERAAQSTVQNSGTADKLQFMQDINNVFPFIQIPVKLQEENAKGELYVFEKKKRYNPDEPLTAVLHLELESLGTTDIKVSLFQNNVNAMFEVADDTAVRFFKDELPALSERLTKIGFTFNSDFRVHEPEALEKPLLYQLLEAHSPKNYSRYTFDVHA